MRKVTREELMEMVENDEDYSQVDVSEITNFTDMFNKKTVKFDISGWDTSSAELMCFMFANAICPFSLENWNVSNVVNMSFMFHHSKYNHPLNKWDVSNVKNMKTMFCKSKYNHPLNDWDVSNVVNMSFMFSLSKYNHPLNAWDVSNVINMEYMFNESSYNHPLNNWDVSNVENMIEMFFSSKYTHPLNNWKIKKEGWSGNKMFFKNCLNSYPEGVSLIDVYEANSFPLRLEHEKESDEREVERHLVDGCLVELNLLETKDFFIYDLNYQLPMYLVKIKGSGSCFYFIQQKNHYFKIKEEISQLILNHCLVA